MVNKSLEYIMGYSARMHHENELMQEALNVIASGSWETIYAYCEKNDVNTHKRVMGHGTIVETIARHALGQIEDA